MLRKIIELYKIPLLITLALAMVLISFKIERGALPIALIFTGAFFGTFVLDLDYFIYAFFLEPTADFSKTLKSFIKHADLLNALTYIYHQRGNITDKALNSALFQIVLAGMALLVVSSEVNYLAKALILSTFTNSIYRMVRLHFEERLASWFWMLKIRPSVQTLYIYTAGLLGVLLVCLSLF